MENVSQDFKIYLSQKEEARRFLNGMEDYLRDRTASRTEIRQEIDDTVQRAKVSTDERHLAYPEGAFLNLYAVPKIHPRGSVQKRPTGVSSKPANGSGPERLEVVPDHELAMQGKTGLFPQSSKKIVLRRPQPRFLEAAHGSGHGFSDAWGSVGDLVLQLRGPHLRM